MYNNFNNEITAKVKAILRKGTIEQCKILHKQQSNILEYNYVHCEHLARILYDTTL